MLNWRTPLQRFSDEKCEFVQLKPCVINMIDVSEHDKLSIGKKNHGSCVKSGTGTLLSMRPSAAWDIWDKVWRAKKTCLIQRWESSGP